MFRNALNVFCTWTSGITSECFQQEMVSSDRWDLCFFELKVEVECSGWSFRSSLNWTSCEPTKENSQNEFLNNFSAQLSSFVQPSELWSSSWRPAGRNVKIYAQKIMMNIIAMKWYNSPETKAAESKFRMERKQKKARSEQKMWKRRKKRARENINRKIQSYIPFYCWMLYE